MSLFNRHWYGIQGYGTEHYPHLAIRVQTAKDGPWQSLNPGEIEQLLKEHNDTVRAGKKSAAKTVADPVGKVVRDAVRAKPAKKEKKK